MVVFWFGAGSFYALNVFSYHIHVCGDGSSLLSILPPNYYTIRTFNVSQDIKGCVATQGKLLPSFVPSSISSSSLGENARWPQRIIYGFPPVICAYRSEVQPPQWNFPLLCNSQGDLTFPLCAANTCKKPEAFLFCEFSCWFLKKHYFPSPISISWHLL